MYTGGGGGGGGRFHTQGKSSSHETEKNSKCTQRFKIPVEKEGEHLQDFLPRIDDVCKINELDERFYATKLTKFLSGRSLSVIDSLKPDDRTDYQKNKSAVFFFKI